MEQQTNKPRLVLPADSNNWHIHADGKYISTRTSDKARAQIKLQQYVSERKEVSSRNDEYFLTFREMIESHAQYIERKNPKTYVRKWRSLFKRLSMALGHHNISDLQDAEMNCYIDCRRSDGVEDATIRQEIVMIRAAWHRAYYKRKTNVPYPHFDLPQNGESSEVWLTRDEAERLFAACRHNHERLFLALGFGTAGRHEALLELTWSRVDLDTGIVDLRKSKSETGGRKMKRRSKVRVDGQLLEFLRYMRDLAETPNVIEYRGKPVKNMGDAFARILARAGIDKDATPHSMRHSAATWMAIDGIPASEIASVLGNTEKVVEAVYKNFFPIESSKSTACLSRLNFSFDKKKAGR